MGRGSGSKASAGCGAFGLVGVLVTVGIVAWLFVTSTDSLTSRSPNRRSTTTSAPAAAPPPVTVTVTPAAGLGADPDVKVAARGWSPGSNVILSTCLSGAGLVLGGESPCDPESLATLAADDEGSITGTYLVDRIVTTGGLSYDCADGGVACAVRATGTAADGRPATGDAIVTFQPGLPAPDLLDELGG